MFWILHNIGVLIILISTDSALNYFHDILKADKK